MTGRGGGRGEPALESEERGWENKLKGKGYTLSWAHVESGENIQLHLEFGSVWLEITLGSHQCVWLG